MSIVPGSQTPGNGCSIFIEAFISSTRTSDRPGRKSMSMLSKVYCRIWCSVESIHIVMSDTLFIFSSISIVTLADALIGSAAAFVEQLGGVVLDAENIAVVEPLACCERVVAGLELESQEVGHRDELWLERTAQHIDRCDRISR